MSEEFQVEQDISERRRIELRAARNVLVASTLEIFILLGLVVVAWWFERQNQFDIWRKAPRVEGDYYRSISDFDISAIMSISVILVGGILILSVFQYLLVGKSLLVSALHWARSVATELLRLLSSKDQSKQKKREPVDTEDYFSRFIDRSAQLVSVSQRRPNALLFVGTVVATIGLAVFIATIPGLFAPQSQQLNDYDMTKSIIELLPKLLMLLFVQVLAGFFLRQYRMSMEELRYYEAILRYRESQMLAYTIRTEHGAGGGELEVFAKELLGQRDFLTMRPGQTNMLLETQRMEENEFKGLYERILDLINDRLPKSSTQRTRASARRSATGRKRGASSAGNGKAASS